MRALALVALVGCYNPHPELGAPCDEAAPVCPVGQSCVSGYCGGQPRVALDAPSDTPQLEPLPGDRDGDGIADDVDNCPDIPNADQANKDGDTFGDVCDPCPIQANDTPSDPDNDGVADICDPHPTTAGDSLIVFEGFYAGVPALWGVDGQLTNGSGYVTFTDPSEAYTDITPNVGPLANGTVTASLEPDTQTGDQDSGISVAMPYDPVSGDGIFCMVYAPNAASSSGRYISLWDATAQKEIGSAQLAWTTGVAYTVALTRSGQNYTCTVLDTAGTAHTATGSSSSTVASSKAAITTYELDGKANWMMVVTSP